MAYEKTNWVSDVTPLSPGNMNKIETGIKDAHDNLTTHEAENVTDIGGVHGLIVEEGIFTPELKFGGANTGITYLTQFGSYRRIGNEVHFEIEMALASKGTATGNATITGLPVITAPDKPTRAYALAAFAFITAALVGASLLEASTLMTLFKPASGTELTVLNNAQFANNSAFRISGSYRL